MSSGPWRIRLGRLALAKLHYQAIGEWRRLWWRLWWRVGPRPPKKLAPPPAPPPQPKRGPMHWVADATRLPLCGASIRERWTLEYEVVTCEACIAAGKMLLLEYWVSNR